MGRRGKREDLGRRLSGFFLPHPPPYSALSPAGATTSCPVRGRELVWGHWPRTQLWCPFSALLRVKVGSLPFAPGLPGALGVSLGQSSASTAWDTSLPAPPLPPPLAQSGTPPPPPPPPRPPHTQQSPVSELAVISRQIEGFSQVFIILIQITQLHTHTNTHVPGTAGGARGMRADGNVTL